MFKLKLKLKKIIWDQQYIGSEKSMSILYGDLSTYEPIPLKSFSQFLGSFEPIFDSKLRG